MQKKRIKNAASHGQARDRVFVSLLCSVFALFCIFDVSKILLCATVRLNSKLSGPWNSEDSRTLHKWNILEQFLLFKGWRSCSRIHFGVHVQLRLFPCEKVNGTLGRSLFQQWSQWCGGPRASRWCEAAAVPRGYSHRQLHPWSSHCKCLTGSFAAQIWSNVDGW